MTPQPGDEPIGRAREILADHLPVAHRLFLTWSAGGPADRFSSAGAKSRADGDEAKDPAMAAEEVAAILDELVQRPKPDRRRAVADLEPSPELVHALLLSEGTGSDPESHYEWIGYGVELERRRRSQTGRLDGGYRREYLEELVDLCRLGLDVLYRPLEEVDDLMALLSEELGLGVMSHFDLLSGWFILGRYASTRGEWSTARTLLGYCEGLARQFDVTEHHARANLELAAVSLASGESDCLVPLARVWRAASRGLAARTSRRLGMLTAQACLRLNHPLEARHALDWLERYPSSPLHNQEGHPEGVVLWLQAHVLAARDPDSARHVLDMAAEHFADSPDGPLRQYWLARLALDRLRVALDEDGPPVEPDWREGLDLQGAPARLRRIFDDLGDSPDGDQVAAAVLRLEAVGPHGFVRLERESAP